MIEARIIGGRRLIIAVEETMGDGKLGAHVRADAVAPGQLGRVDPGLIDAQRRKPRRRIADINRVINLTGILAQIEDRQDKVAPKVAFETGEQVKVTDGPFQNFTGMIEEVDAARGKLKISVSIFGRSTPVELEYWQVERA